MEGVKDKGFGIISPLQTLKFSRSPKNGLQENQKLDTNDTDYNDTDFSDPYFSLPGNSPINNPDKENEGKNTMNTLNEIIRKAGIENFHYAEDFYKRRCIMGDLRDVLRVEGVKAKGFGIIGKLAMLDFNLTIEAKAIYAYFCSYAGAGSTAFPSVSKIITDLGIGEKRYYKHFKLLKDFGYVKVEQVMGEKGQFRHNIYSLVENPIPVEVIAKVAEEIEGLMDENIRIPPSSQNDSTVEKEPSSQNDGTGQITFPSSRFACAENDGTNNNISSLKITDIYNSICLSNYKDISNNNCINLDEAEENDRQKNKNQIFNELQQIIDKAEIQHLNYADKEAVLQAIKLLYFNKKGIKNRNSYIPYEVVREDLKRISPSICDHAWNKFEKAAVHKEIKNSISYLASCIYDSIFSIGADIHAELKREEII